MADTLCSWNDAVRLLHDIRLSSQIETVPLRHALGRRLAAPVYALSDSPRFRASAMDGWALQGDDLRDDRQGLTVTGSVLAGHPPLPLRRGETFAVMTGAPLPTEAAGVIPVEHARAEDGKLTWDTEASTRHIREQGEDFRTGHPLLDQGVRISATHTLLLASAGVGHCDVFCKPTVALLTTGDELQAEPGPYGIYDGTTTCLQALIAETGGDLRATAHLHDDLPATVAVLDQHLRAGTGLILTTGGVSKGMADFIPQAVTLLGGSVRLHRLAIKPAKPLLVATFPNGTVLVGLPGNPISQLVAFYLAVAPLLRGRAPLDIDLHAARVGSDIEAKTGMLTFLRADLRCETTRLLAHVLPAQESHRVSNLATMQGWVLARGPLRAGETVDVLPLTPLAM